MREDRKPKPRLTKEQKKEASDHLKAEVDGFLAQIDGLLADDENGERS